MEVAEVTRLARIERRVLWGLIAENIATSDAGDARWEQDRANWRGVRRALERAADGATPARSQDEPPRWLTTAARSHLEWHATHWPFQNEAMTVRVLERLGLIELEHDDAYVLALVGGLVGDPRFAAESRADVLRADPELREAIIWRLFEVEGGGEISLANIDKFTGETRRWSTTFRELVEDGTLARDDVLTASLQALGRDFSAYRAGWFSRLYRSFEPAPDEAARHQHLLRDLLRSSITATVSMSLRTLNEVSRAGLLDDEETASALAAALEHESRSTADLVLRLAEVIAKRRTDLRFAIADLVSLAVTHPHPQVQERAGRLMQKLGVGDRLREHRGEISPGAAARLGLREDSDADAGRAGVEVGPLPTDAARQPPIGEARGDELVELVAALLEDGRDTVGVERILAGLAQTGQSDALVPLAKRAAAVLTRGPREMVTSGWLRGQIARLVLRSTGEQVPQLPWTWDPGDRDAARHVALRFLAARIEEVVSVVAGASPPLTLAATLEHPAGWLRPETFVSRVVDGAGMTHDMVGALLRLSPDGRLAALEELDRSNAAMPRSVRRVLRHALGAPSPKPRPIFRGSPNEIERALWVAAARARDPWGADPWAEHLGLTGTGRAQPLTLRLGAPQPWVADMEIRDEHRPWIAVESPVRGIRDDQPTGTDDTGRRSLDWAEAEDYVPWAATVFPADAEHLSWIGGLAVAERATSYAEVRHDAVRVLDALRTHEGRLGRLTQAVIVAGLGAAGVDERVRAVDAVAHLGRAGRLSSAGVAAGMVDAGPLMPLPRLAGSLRDVAATGPTTAGLVIDAITAALPAVPPTTRGVYALLEVLDDELLRAGRPTPVGLSPWLGTIRGSSRASGLATALLARTP